MINEYEIEIDDSTSSLLDAIAGADDDPLVLAAVAEIDADEFRQFMTECGEHSREAVQVLKAAELLEHSRKEALQGDHRTRAHHRLPAELTYLLIGGGIGAVLGLLLAPKSGEALRGEIAEATRRGIARSYGAAQQLSDRTGEYYETTGAKGSQTAGRTREAAREAHGYTGTVAEAIDAGKNAYEEEKRKTEMSGRIEATANYEERSS